MVFVDRELRDWIRCLAVDPDGPTHPAGPLSDEASTYVARIGGDGTLKAALDDIAADDPELAG